MLSIIIAVAVFCAINLVVSRLLANVAKAVKAEQEALEREMDEEEERANNEFRRIEEESRMKPYAEHSIYLGP